MQARFGVSAKSLSAVRIALCDADLGVRRGRHAGGPSSGTAAFSMAAGGRVRPPGRRLNPADPLVMAS